MQSVDTERQSTDATHATELDIEAIATVHVTSAEPDHLITNVFDRSRGLGGSRWVAQKSGEQSLVLTFHTPQTIRRIDLEIEEQEVSRSQELWLCVSHDNGHTYQNLLRQEYNFSPPGTTFEREQWLVTAQEVTHLRLRVKPDKSGQPCRATVTSLILY